MSRIKKAMAQAIADALVAYDPAIKVKVLQQRPDRAAEYPSVAVLPGDFKVVPWLEEEVCDEAGDPIMPTDFQALMEVGELEGQVQIWVGARYAGKRGDLEESIFGAFFQEGGAPGRLLMSLPNMVVRGIPTGYNAIIAAILTDSTWSEEPIFSERRWAWLTVDVTVPILVLRGTEATPVVGGAVPLIETGPVTLLSGYCIALTEDLETDLTAADTPDEVRALLPDLEEYEVDESGIARQVI